jgi:hypothetical protein
VTCSVPAPEEYDEIAWSTGVDAHMLKEYGGMISVIKAGNIIVGLVNPNHGQHGQCYFAPGKNVRVQPQFR